MASVIRGTGQSTFGTSISVGTGGNILKSYVISGTTTDATETALSTSIPIAVDSTLLAEIAIVARRTDATGHSAGFKLRVVADNFSGTTADVGNVYEIVVADDSGNLEVDARADNTTDSLKIYVTGEASKTIKWTAVVNTIEVHD